MAEEQGFEPWVGYKPTPVFKTGALNHSATPPNERDNIHLPLVCKLEFIISETDWRFAVHSITKHSPYTVTLVKKHR